MTEPLPHRRAALKAGVAATMSAVSYRRAWGANDRVGVGFIGYGLIGKRHVLDFQAQPDAQLVAVAEAHGGRMQEAVALMNGGAAGAARGYRDFRRLLEDRDVDAVVISTPDHWHALQAILACAAGKDVYVEKPLTLFVREGRWMVDAARRFNRVVQVGTQQRSGPHYQQVRDLIRSERIGKVMSVRMASSRNIMPGFGRVPDQSPPPDLDWEMWLGPAPTHPYNPMRAIYHFRWHWDYSGGQMTNLAAHEIDIMNWCLDLKGPTSVYSVGGRFALDDGGETPDTQDTIFEYPGLTATWSHREASSHGLRGTLIPLEIFGTKGSISLARTGFTLTPDRRLIPANVVPQFAGAHPVGGPARVADPGTTTYWTEPASDQTGNAQDQLKRHVRDFLDCVKSRQTPLSDLESGHRVAVACHLANLSLQLGRKIRWDAEREEIIGDPEAAKRLVRPYRAPWDQELRALGIG